MQDSGQQDHLADIGWEQMRQMLDKEMPERRRGFLWWWWLPVFLAITGGTVFAWLAFQPLRESQAPPAQKVEKGIYPKEAVPQAKLEFETPALREFQKDGVPTASASDRLAQSGIAGERSSFGPLSKTANIIASQITGTLDSGDTEQRIPPSGDAGMMEAGPTYIAPDAKFQDLAAIAPRLYLRTIPQRVEDWEFAPLAPDRAKSNLDRWSFWGEASALTNISSSTPQSGAAAGVHVARPVSNRMALLSGISLERMGSAIETPFSGTATVMDVSVPSFGAPNRGSTTVDLAEEVPVRSWGLFLPLLAQVRLNNHWRLEGGGRVGFMLNHSLNMSLAPEQLRESAPVLATAMESPFAGLKGQSLDPGLFKTVDAQLSLEAGRMLGRNWIAYARYRHGLGNGVKIEQYEVRSRIIQIGVKYRFDQ